MGGCAAFGSGCTVEARQGCILQERGLLNQALTMELRGRGRGDGCSEAGSLGAGMVGAREGQKRRQEKGRTQALVRVEDGGKNEDIDGGRCCDVHRMCISPESGERRGNKDGYDRKQ